jgi:hypothetical protein
MMVGSVETSHNKSFFFKVEDQHNGNDRNQGVAQQRQSIFDQVKISRWIKGAQADKY